MHVLLRTSWYLLVWPGVCEDDADARNKSLAKNLTGFEVTSARGTGQCTCSPPFLVMAANTGSAQLESVWTDMQKWTWPPRSIFSGKFVHLANLANSKISRATRNALFVQEAMSH